MPKQETLPPEERIKAICDEANAIVDAKATELKKEFEGLPYVSLRRDLENKAPGCACRQALAILREGE
ncbi:hypothetical protein [Bradyrhizobium diazoefficiens]|uniref:hypothetical protein n=1 Tax=Bradyrhizobium diazoefficiens TaxID=1355477 RepID=UPI0027296CA9|nr:hypothetical protein [Bradyrhizobium diazoefficiens]WLA65830.1 hypothetical protein QNN01_02785 [Bradyrhizobium diazoefficiens]